MVTPTFHYFNYADCRNARAEFNPTVFWFYSKTKDPALIYLQKRLLEQEPARKSWLLPLAMIWGAGSGASLENPPEPKQLSWMGQGTNPVMAARSSWSDPGALYLGFKAGSPQVSHAHMDVGSFVFEADGVHWAMDFGLDEYHRLESRGVRLWANGENGQRWEVFRFRSTSHNLVTFDGKNQRAHGVAKIDDYGDRSGIVYAMSDLSDLYSTQVAAYKRAVSLVDKRYAVIQDLVTTNDQSVKMRWNMLTEADENKLTEVPNVVFFSDGHAWLKKGNKMLCLRVESPVPVRFFQKDTTPEEDYNSPNEGNQFVGFEVELPANTTQEIRVYLIPGETVTAPKPGYQFKK